MDRPERFPLRVGLGPGGEFDLIRRLVGADEAAWPGVEVGPGDDAAVLEGGWVLSTDLSIEDVHFRRSWLSDREVGYRAASAALSDLAAMAAEPVGILLSLAMPEHDVDIVEVQAGAREAVTATGGAVLGGDLSRSPGLLVVDVVALGRTARPLLRAGALAGDDLWVTGVLGASAAAVTLWSHEREPDAALREAFARPHARVSEARFLADGGGVHALIDLSDGLAGDAGHLGAAGGVRIVLEAGLVPVAEAAARALGPEEAASLALHGGEDYELLLAARPGSVDVEAFDARFGLPIRRVGRVEEGSGVWIEERGTVRRLQRGGFSHVGTDRR